MSASKKNQIVILHTRLSGYLAACLRELKRQANADLLIYAYPSTDEAPFDDSVFADLGEVRNRRDASVDGIEAALRAFRPDAILTSGWSDRGYMKICRQLRKELGIPVIAGCDTQWKGSLRQHVAALIAPWRIQQSIDVLWVSGERQRTLASALGYQGNQCWDGVYACDWGRFAERASAKRMTDGGWRMADDPFFLYVGRYVDVKGIDILAEAYQRYRTMVEKPWRLVCAGSGPLAQTLIEAGAEDRGFVQPSDLPALMAEASAFVLPSRFEPWGVVVQEAAASGLPLICSDACGAGVHLLRDQSNGYAFPAGDVQTLVGCMLELSNLPELDYQEFAKMSFELSKQYTPERWVKTLCAGIERLKEGS